MTEPYRKTATSKQLEIAFDAARLGDLSPAERRQAVTSLAILLTEAAGASKTEPSDDRL
jgi:hypothetical protein